MAITSVAVVGASGNVGKAVVTALLASGFAVTAITRPSSTATFPPAVPVKRADPTSFDELRAALAGFDAVVSATAHGVAAGAGQDALIDAAAAAGVRRFVPSEFGHSDERFGLSREGEAARKMLDRKARTAAYLAEKASANPGFSWTGVGTSMFFDWVSVSLRNAKGGKTD